MLFFKRKEKRVIDAEWFEYFYKHYDNDRDRLEGMYQYLTKQDYPVVGNRFLRWDREIMEG